MAPSVFRGIGLAHFSAIHLQPAELVSQAAAAGFASVGLRLFPAFPGAPCYELPRGGAAAREVRARLEGEGVALHDIEFVVIGAEFDPGTVASVLEDAASLGARRISACGDDADHERLVANFAALCALASEFGLSVDLENMGWRPVAWFTESLCVARASGAANAGALVDALHFFRNEGRLADLAAAPAHLVRHVQLCDAAGPSPANDADRIAEARGGRLAPGAGDFDLGGLLRSAPGDVAVSVEVPIAEGAPVEGHLARLFAGARAIREMAEAAP